MKKLSLYLFTVALAITACNFKSEPVDLILHNAVIYTNNPEQEKAQAVAIKGNRIVALGAERKILNTYQAAKSIDLKGAFVYPGFVDAHCHFLGLGETLQQVNLQGVRSFDEFAEKLHRFHRNHPEQWIYGRGWDESLWPDKKIPSIAQLDSLFPNTPVYLKRVDGHAAVINSVVANMINVRPSLSIQGGLFVYKNKQFTGHIIDEAMTLVDNILPPFNTTQQAKAFLAAQSVCFKNGLTALTDAGLDIEHILLIDSLHQGDDLKIMLNVMASDKAENKNYLFKNGHIQTERLQVNSFKFYADGSLGSRSAKLKHPYHDHTGSGMLMKDPDYFQHEAEQMHAHNFQMNTHCIGDSAVALMLRVYANVLGGTNDRRWRIEHAQVVSKNDLHVFKQYSIIPSVQPTHALSDRRWAKKRLGAQRLGGAYAYKDLLATNGMLAFGTDFPVEQVSPLRTFFAAVFRKEPGEQGDGWQTGQALSRAEALKAMTIGPAIAAHQDSLYGSIEPGKLANFTILDTDLLNDSEKRLAQTRVLKTLVMGEIVYENIE